MNKKKKKHLTLLFLCAAFGLLGAHRFYKGKNVTGTIMLLTLGGIGVWYLVDLSMILMGKFSDKKKKKKTLTKKAAYS
ncbi:MAG: TM2 domain-containing protein [Chlamydiota bacterium]